MKSLKFNLIADVMDSKGIVKRAVIAKFRNKIDCLNCLTTLSLANPLNNYTITTNK